jgi:hypothetical protein
MVLCDRRNKSIAIPGYFVEKTSQAESPKSLLLINGVIMAVVEVM